MQKTSLTALARGEMETASTASSGRSSKTVYGGHEKVLRQTVVALRAGQELGEHDNPGESTIFVLSGRIMLKSAESSWSGWIGDLLIVPDVPHSVEALEDSVMLLTVAKLR